MQGGSCSEISIEGMRVELGDPFAPGSSGTVSLNYESLSMAVPVSVVRSDLTGNGLRFVYDSEEQRDAVARLVTCLASPLPCTSLVLRRSRPELRLPALLSSN